ncbi:MAG TPA: dTMP kinase, partial [Polyangia bacterium]|nr:dTMP kinase [Polyangia bacterium]
MFVVFEGIDGSGKTTISNRVADRLKASGVSVTHLRAQGKFASAVTESIRELARDARNLHLCPQAELLLYVARDVQLIEEVLRPALRLNDVIVADRFLYTPQVLGHHGRHLSDAWMAPILTAAAGGIEPDLVVLVDVDPVLARARRKSAKLAAADDRPPARKGLAGVGLQHRLRRGYLELAAAAPDRWMVVENDDAPMDDIVARVTALVEEARQAGAPAALQRLRANTTVSGPRSERPLESPGEALQALLQWIDRRAEREPRVAAYVLADLAGAGVDERRRALASRVPEAILAGLTGLADATSWELRQSLQGTHPNAVALTLLGLAGDDPRAQAMRQSLEALCPAEIAMSLSGLDADAAWAARERLFASHADAVVASLGRVSGARSWALRERWLDGKRSQLGTSYEVARAGARSVTACAEDAAWHVRDRARPIAPVAALASIEGLRDQRAWAWRREHLFRAPKVVMATLRGVRDPEAWEMRRTVAADCKEALDSVVALDDREAWDLREAHADTWPSTVVKTLGPLAQTPRGQALVKRQLARHGHNVSLLKHAAAIALATLVLAVGVLATGCGSTARGAGDGGPPPDGGLAPGRLLPWKVGNSWTYRVTGPTSTSTKVTTI